MQSSQEEHIIAPASKPGIVAISLPKHRRTISWLLTRLSLVLALAIGYLLTDRLIEAYLPPPAGISSLVSATLTPSWMRRCGRRDMQPAQAAYPCCRR